MSTTETELTKLRHAIDEMNKQPDISANDSPRLRELCRVSAVEIKAVGGVSATTSLEMIGYIRELERSRVGEDDYVAWCRYTYNPEGGIQSIVTCDSDAKGAFKVYRASPSDFEQLIRLRKHSTDLVAWTEWWQDPTSEAYPAELPPLKEIIAALREALAQSKGEKS